MGKMRYGPKAYLEFCTTRVFLMEELQRVKLSEGFKGEMHLRATQQRKPPSITWQKSSNMNRRARRRVKSAVPGHVHISLDKKRILGNILSHCCNLTVGLLPAKNKWQTKDKSELPMNHATLIDDLLYVHGREVLVNRQFNGNPHPVRYPRYF